jgi:hypothetical protein
MPIQVDGAFVRAPCPVPSYPACEPNSGSVFPSLSTKAYSGRGADIVMQSLRQLCRLPVYQARGLRLESPTLRGLSRSGSVNRSPALCKAATATHSLPSLGKSVVVAQLLSVPNPPRAEKPQAPPELPQLQIGLATVVNQLGASSAHCAVNRPVRVQLGQIVQLAASPWRAMQKPPSCLYAVDLLPCILDQLASPGNIFPCADTQPVDP